MCINLEASDQGGVPGGDALKSMINWRVYTFYYVLSLKTYVDQGDGFCVEGILRIRTNHLINGLGLNILH